MTLPSRATLGAHEVSFHIRILAAGIVSAACIAYPFQAHGNGQRVQTTSVSPARWTPSEWSTPEYETTPAFSPDGSKAVFMRADRAFGRYRLMESECIDGRWTTPREPAFAAATPMHDGDPFITHDGASLYFISTRHRYHEVGNDDFDIFVVSRGVGGMWGTPERLPEPINSAGSELLPSVDREGVLYFGSNRAGGRGGSDVYRATRDPRGIWHVTNVAAVNTEANEYEADVSADGTRLAVVSDRIKRSRVYLYRRIAGTWEVEKAIDAYDEVFQVGPRLSPDGKRLLFGQDAGAASGELFLVDIARDPDPRWPPQCGVSRTPWSR